MSKRPPNKYSPNQEHAKYGVIKWFKMLEVNDPAIHNEVIYRYLETTDFNMRKIDKDYSKYVFINRNHFRPFSRFALDYLKENNYIK